MMYNLLVNCPQVKQLQTKGHINSSSYTNSTVYKKNSLTNSEFEINTWIESEISKPVFIYIAHTTMYIVTKCDT